MFFNSVGDAVWIQPHNDVPKRIRIFNNTVIASGTGIRVTGGDPQYLQKVIGNAVFAESPINAADQADNITDSYGNASNYLVNPSGNLGQLDLYPLADKLTGPPMETGFLQSFVDWNRDFNGALHDGTFRGAYAGQGQNPGWLPALEVKSLLVKDATAPGAVMDLRITGMTGSSITLSWTAPGDDGNGGGPVTSFDLRYSDQPPGADVAAWFEAATKVNGLPLPRPPGSPESFTMTGLDLDTEPIFILRSIDDSGNLSDFSNPTTETPVPVELVNFVAQTENGSVKLTWSIAKESNNFGFEVEKKRADSKWRKIAFVPGRGTTVKPKVYSYMDKGLSPGIYFYRLKQIDYEGTFAYSTELHVQLHPPQRFSLAQNYPNPFNPETTIRYEVAGLDAKRPTHTRLMVFNLLGQRVRTLVNKRLTPGFY